VLNKFCCISIQVISLIALTFIAIAAGMPIISKTTSEKLLLASFILSLKVHENQSYYRSAVTNRSAL
jgi:hypothetical protein